MNELNELELNKEVENIKAKIIFEQEKIGALSLLFIDFADFLDANRRDILTSSCFFLCG